MFAEALQLDQYVEILGTSIRDEAIARLREPLL